MVLLSYRTGFWQPTGMADPNCMKKPNPNWLKFYSFSSLKH